MYTQSKEANFAKEDGNIDFVKDDSGIVIKTDKGLVVISGCAHAGICNTIEYLRNMDITHIKTGHCTGFPVLVQLANIFDSKFYYMELFYYGIILLGQMTRGNV